MGKVLIKSFVCLKFNTNILIELLWFNVFKLTLHLYNVLEYKHKPKKLDFESYKQYLRFLDLLVLTSFTLINTCRKYKVI